MTYASIFPLKGEPGPDIGVDGFSEPPESPCMATTTRNHQKSPETCLQIQALAGETRVTAWVDVSPSLRLSGLGHSVKTRVDFKQAFKKTQNEATRQYDIPRPSVQQHRNKAKRGAQTLHQLWEKKT